MAYFVFTWTSKYAAYYTNSISSLFLSLSVPLSMPHLALDRYLSSYWACYIPMLTIQDSRCVCTRLKRKKNTFKLKNAIWLHRVENEEWVKYWKTFRHFIDSTNIRNCKGKLSSHKYVNICDGKRHAVNWQCNWSLIEIYSNDGKWKWQKCVFEMGARNIYAFWFQKWNLQFLDEMMRSPVCVECRKERERNTNNRCMANRK